MLASASAAPTDELSDADLVSRATAVFASKEAPAQRFLGVHHRLPVVVDIRCGDICPQYTVRIIHYMAEAGRACAAMGADTATVVVPKGIGTGQENFCIPHVLYSRKLYVDHPYRK